MKMNDHQHFYSEKSNDASTSRVQIDVDKVTASVKTKCPICQMRLSCILKMTSYL